MLLEQVYLFFIYILIFELAMVTVVAIALFALFVDEVRKLDNKKNTSLLGRERCCFNFLKYYFLRHATFLWCLTFYNYYMKNKLKSQQLKKIIITYLH